MTLGKRACASCQSFVSQSKYCTLHLTLLVSPLLSEWTHLPIPTRNGIKRRLKRCAGCHLSLSGKAATVSCCFRRSGFDGFIPCGTSYHTRCIKVGSPFHSRQKNNQGLAFPTVRFLANFICEACAVRSFTNREILTTKDLYLMKLERMRLIDMS